MRIYRLKNGLSVSRVKSPGLGVKYVILHPAEDDEAIKEVKKYRIWDSVLCLVGQIVSEGGTGVADVLKSDEELAQTWRCVPEQVESAFMQLEGMKLIDRIDDTATDGLVVQ